MSLTPSSVLTSLHRENNERGAQDPRRVVPDPTVALVDRAITGGPGVVGGVRCGDELCGVFGPVDGGVVVLHLVRLCQEEAVKELEVETFFLVNNSGGVSDFLRDRERIDIKSTKTSEVSVFFCCFKDVSQKL